MIDYDSFSHCHLTDIFFRYFRGSKRVKQFMEKKGQTGDIIFLRRMDAGLAFMVDILEYLNIINKQLQGCNKVVTQYYDNIPAFKLKLSL